MSQDACTNGCRPSAPLVSIVTPSFNQAQFLEKTVRSVLSQDYPNIEYIIIDGGSTDGSVEIIKKYEDRLAYWVSEPDKGQAHAINKGWQRATGTIVAYLNSDDLYMPGTVTTAVQALQSQPDECMVYSDALMIDEHGRQLRRLIGRPFDIRHVITSEGFVPQPTAFIRRHALDQVVCSMSACTCAWTTIYGFGSAYISLPATCPASTWQKHESMRPQRRRLTSATLRWSGGAFWTKSIARPIYRPKSSGCAGTLIPRCRSTRQPSRRILASQTRFSSRWFGPW